jgi:hypothetical protein
MNDKRLNAEKTAWHRPNGGTHAENRSFEAGQKAHLSAVSGLSGASWRVWRGPMGCHLSRKPLYGLPKGSVSLRK